MTSSKEENRKWFREARFGMFVHWGLYAITGRDMWYYSREMVPKEEYERLAARFNPFRYDPRKWAALAKRAGVKYAVRIVKHHDGFCLWDSEHTEFKITNTPYGKDLVKPWADAFRAEGLKVGFYYSLIDWHHPHFLVDGIHPQRDRRAELNKGREWVRYVEYMRSQIRELLTNFGEISIFWPDFSYDEKHAPEWQSRELIQLIEELQPGILYNNRFGLKGEIEADFSTPEQFIPADDPTRETKGVQMWEACETIGESWGYHRCDQNNKSTARLISDLVTCVSRNGNLLLNVGPTPRGDIQREFVERLTQIGEWMEVNGESVHGAGPADRPWCNQGCPQRKFAYTQKGKNLYLHLFDGYPAYDLVLAPAIDPDRIEYAEFLSDGTDVPIDLVVIDGERHARLRLPMITPDPYDTVVRIVMRTDTQR